MPTVADRLAQTVVALVLERRAEPVFHQGSYGYRPGRGAIDAVAACRRRCWESSWVIDMDIQAFFDTVPWDLVCCAVATVCDLPWVMLYVRRWLKAPAQQGDGTLTERWRGTPQGSRSYRLWLVCSCTTRSMHGLPGILRGLSSSVTPTMW